MRKTQYPEVLLFKMDAELAASLEQRAESEERPKAWLVRKALENYLKSGQNKSVDHVSQAAVNAFAGSQPY